MASSLTGFTGDFISPLGMVNLHVTYGKKPHSKTLTTKFMVVNIPSAYNTIVGRPTLNQLKVVVSTYHMMMKFPTKASISKFKSDPRESR